MLGNFLLSKNSADPRPLLPGSMAFLRLFFVLGVVGALQLPHDNVPRASQHGSCVTRRGLATLGFALAAQLVPSPAHAQKSKLIARPTAESAAAAKAFRVQKPGEETEAFKAAERRRSDVEAGLTPRDADRTPIRDPVTGKEISKRTYAEALNEGVDTCANRRCEKR